MAERLARWAFVGGSPLKGETIESYGKAVLSAGAGLSNRKPEEVVSTDIKAFEASGFKFAIAQAEVEEKEELIRQRKEQADRLKAQADQLLAQAKELESR